MTAISPAALMGAAGWEADHAAEPDAVPDQAGWAVRVWEWLPCDINTWR